MDSSDARPLRLFNFGKAHAAGVLATVASRRGFFITNIRRAAECSTRGRVRSPEWRFGGHRPSLQDGLSSILRSRHWDFVLLSSFVIRASSFMAGLTSKTVLSGLRHPRIGRNAETFSIFQNVFVHQIAIVIGPAGGG